MESKVLTKIVCFLEEDNFCMCDKTFYKNCFYREQKSLPCNETIIRLTPIDREGSCKDKQSGFLGTLNCLK